MAFGSRKGEWVVVISCGTNRLDGAKPVSNVTRIGVRETRYANCHVAVAGYIAIHFYLILFKKASPLIPNSRNLA